MKQFKIFENPQSRIEAVKQGWSWPAFFFTIIWSFVKKMYALGSILLVAFFVGGVISAAAGGQAEEALDSLVGIAQIILSVVFGVNANRWRENNLQKRGFDYKTTVSAANAEGAAAWYMKQKISGSPSGVVEVAWCIQDMGN